MKKKNPKYENFCIQHFEIWNPDITFFIEADFFYLLITFRKKYANAW